MIEQQDLFEFDKLPPIKGFPELRWTNKRPYRSTQYYPAQLKETYGQSDENGWINKIFWGDNLQVMSHMLRKYRGKVDLIYIDPPFDSKAEYKKKIKIKVQGSDKNQQVLSDSLSFEEKQYGDIWTNDEYLQFMYERLILLKELLSENGSIYLHCDWHKSHYLRLVMDEIFGKDSFQNEIIWYYRRWNIAGSSFATNHDSILFYTKSTKGHTYNQMYIPKSEKSSAQGKSWKSIIGEDGIRRSVQTEEPTKGVPMPDVWEISMINPVAKERTEIGYPTQKPENLIERIIKASSNPGDIVFDCFMGSGTTQAVASKLGRRYIGADINLGAVQTSTKRLLKIIDERPETTGFEVYNVNDYDFFRNELEAKQLIIDALEVQPMPASNIYDGELDGRMVKIMPINRITTKADLSELIANFPYDIFSKRKEASPSEPVERITIVCMGHEPDLKAALLKEVGDYKLDVNIVDILKDKKALQLKRESEGLAVVRDGQVNIESFFPMNLLQKLSLDEQNVEDWKQLVESILIDFNYDGAVLNPTEIDIPDKKTFVKGVYDIPEDAGTIRIKITDILSESLEIEAVR
ncbi:site-specific DNA-methyltransferase (plasmid) [Enterococcus casseliflavus]|uniref:site-specific DNA-methyltransferase n=1 Tax=Enterococcus casseliflavus TaxID=37734 RepID=UPI000EB413C6|nr:site-specific DNA-methyltransferase [Enterococcus casseliflavus]AYJ46912.1 site-specific DNA-methyltransferase [Enterococcus casseliflavus]